MPAILHTHTHTHTTKHIQDNECFTESPCIECNEHLSMAIRAGNPGIQKTGALRKKN